jgi:hypothetical protein
LFPVKRNGKGLKSYENGDARNINADGVTYLEMDHYKKEITSQFLKVGQGVYLAKDDPRFLEKYVKYFPNDAEKQYEFGQLLESRGRKQDAIVAYRRALKNGYISANSKLVAMQEKNTFPIVNEEDQSGKRPVSLMLLGLLNFLLFAAVIFLFVTLFQGNPLLSKAIGQVSEVNNANSSNQAYLNCTDCEKTPLPVVVVQNALERFKEKEGEYPDDLKELVGNPPNNWLSLLPEGLEYSTAEESYVLKWKGSTFTSSSKGRTLQLYLYPEANELAVMQGETTLAIYEVAIGKEGSELPYKNSRIEERVVNPNGGDGPLGTRGLKLSGDYAIHGTNDPNSIGRKVTLGCIRLTNDEMEALYPLISLGTPFTVKEGKPDLIPLYPDGFPKLMEGSTQNLTKEERPQIIYNWKS